jgi:TPR repeat protein
MYRLGVGVPKDLVQAHVWWNIAGANGNEEAKKNLAIVEKKMTDTQKEKAMDLARELFAKLPKKK